MGAHLGSKLAHSIANVLSIPKQHNYVGFSNHLSPIELEILTQISGDMCQQI